MGVTSGVDQAGIILITLKHRRFAPFAERSGGELQDSAGHCDGHAFISEAEDQRVHHFGLAPRDRSAFTYRDDRPHRQGQPLSTAKVRPCTATQRLTWIDGTRRSMVGQRRNEAVLRPSAKQRTRPATLAHPSPTPPCDRDLDRAHLPPTPPPKRTRQAHPGTARTSPHTSRNRVLKFVPRESTELGIVSITLQPRNRCMDSATARQTRPKGAIRCRSIFRPATKLRSKRRIQTQSVCVHP